MTITFITPVDVVPADDDTFQDVDLTAHIPGGMTNAVGAIIRLTSSSGVARNYGFNKGGGTDTFVKFLRDTDAHVWFFVGIDVNDIFELNLQTSSATYQVHVYGFFDTEDAFFLANDVLFASGTPPAWEDIDITDDLDGSDDAVAAIFKFYNSSSSAQDAGFQHKSSTDDRNTKLGPDNLQGGFITGIDSNDVCEFYRGAATSGSARLVGYLKSTSEITVNVNGTDVSLSTTGSFANLPNLPSDITAGFFEVVLTTADQDYGFRKDGETGHPQEGTVGDGVLHGYGAAEAASNIIEGFIAATDIDMFLLVYTTAAAGLSPVEIITMLNRDKINPIRLM